jgi:hypothetical protein
MTAAIAGVLLATLAFTAAPAYADDPVDVNLGGVSSNAFAGAPTFDAINVTFTNKSANVITNVRGVFTIHLDGMPEDGVRIQRAFGVDLPTESAGDGTVRISDPAAFELGRNNRRETTYQLQFGSTAPAGKASITFELYSGGTRLGGDGASTTVRGFANPTTKTTPPNTNPGIVPTFEAGPTYSLAPLPQSNDLASADVPASLYVMGGLLVALGGVILFLLFRRQRPGALVAHTTSQYETPQYEEVRPPSLGYPTAPAMMRPTAMLPTVRDAEPPDAPRRRPRP